MLRIPFFLIFLVICLAFAGCDQTGPANSTILIIRHAEKSTDSNGLSARGIMRANAYPKFFENFKVGTQPLHLDAIFATQDSENSRRPRQTIAPLALATKLPVDTTFESEQTSALAKKIRTTQQGKTVLVCWHHGSMPDLLRAFGVKPETILPKGGWPDSAYDWVIKISFDQNGKPIPTQTTRTVEGLLPGDSK